MIVALYNHYPLLHLHSSLYQPMKDERKNKWEKEERKEALGPKKDEKESQQTTIVYLNHNIYLETRYVCHIGKERPIEMKVEHKIKKTKEKR